MQPLTPRERLKKTLLHQSPDKIPLDLGGHQTGIHLDTYRKVLTRLGIDDPQIRLYDYVQQLAKPCEALLQRFQIDTRTVYLPRTVVDAGLDKDKESYKEYIGFTDQFGIFWGRNPVTTPQRIFYDAVGNPFQDFTTPQQIEEYSWPKVDTSLFEGAREVAANLHQNTGYALIGRSIGSIYQWSHYLFGLSKFLKLLLRNPTMITAALDGMIEYVSSFADHYLDAVGKYIQTVQYTSDLTDQQGPMVNPAHYRKYIKPYHQKLLQHIRAKAAEINPDLKIVLHSCGSSIAHMPDILDLGFDALNPVQVSAADMEPRSLKTRFGNQITFWGGLCDSQHTLPFGTINAVAEETAQNMRIFKLGGGYVGASIHNICYGVPPENVVAMFDAAIHSRNKENM
jgi:uroporphyrinogen decarboxylase